MHIGTYKTDAGVSFRVEEEGVVAEVIESETEETETVEEEMSEELAKEDEDYEEEADVGDWRGMEKRIENLEIAVAKLKEDKEGGDDEVEEMAEEVSEPSDKPKSIKTTETVEFSAEEVEAIKAENEKLKTELAESPADSPINTNKFSSEKPQMSKAAYNRLSKRERILMDF